MPPKSRNSQSPIQLCGLCVLRGESKPLLHKHLPACAPTTPGLAETQKTRTKDPFFGAKKPF